MRAFWVGPVAVLAASAALSLAQQNTSTAWISAGTTGVLPSQAEFATPMGRVGVLLSGGPIEMKGHPFFTPLGKNGLACVTCHQPAYGMSFSAEAARDLWKRTGGKGRRRPTRRARGDFAKRTGRGGSFSERSGCLHPTTTRRKNRSRDSCRVDPRVALVKLRIGGLLID